MATAPKGSRRARPAPPPAARPAPAWPVAPAFSPGVFVREREHPARWGRLVGPASEPQRWLIQYSTGARMTARSDEIAEFTPTAAEQALVEKATRSFERAMRRVDGR